jgi:RimJ/RimL family protein N-acetyltransferase
MAKKEDPSLYPTPASLVGNKVYLRAMEAEDTAITYLWHLHTEPQSQTCHQAILVTPKEMVEAAKKREKKPTEGDFAIVRKEDDKIVGKIRFFNLNMINRSAELGYIIDPEEHKKGYGKEGLTILVRYLFIYLNLNKVYAQTAVFNTPSVNLLKSLDFKLDGTLRQHHFYHGTLHDDLVFSLLRFECGFLGDI